MGCLVSRSGTVPTGQDSDTHKGETGKTQTNQGADTPRNRDKKNGGLKDHPEEETKHSLCDFKGASITNSAR